MSRIDPRPFSSRPYIFKASQLIYATLNSHHATQVEKSEQCCDYYRLSRFHVFYHAFPVSVRGVHMALYTLHDGCFLIGLGSQRNFERHFNSEDIDGY